MPVDLNVISRVASLVNDAINLNADKRKEIRDAVGLAHGKTSALLADCRLACLRAETASDENLSDSFIAYVDSLLQKNEREIMAPAEELEDRLSSLLAVEKAAISPPKMKAAKASISSFVNEKTEIIRNLSSCAAEVSDLLVDRKFQDLREKLKQQRKSFEDNQKNVDGVYSGFKAKL